MQRRSGMTMAPRLLIQPNFQAMTMQLILTILVNLYTS